MQLTYVLCTRICDCGGIDQYASKIFEIQNGQNWLLKYQKLQKISKVYNTDTECAHGQQGTRKATANIM